MKILTVIGARPQFIKASVVSRALRAEGLLEVVIHTGQHYDANMSDIFFDQLGIPRPDYLLDINGGGHGEMTGRMMSEIESIIFRERPALLLVYGDTNSTLAGALAAAKLHVPVCHVEAGLRSFDMGMPEEINRVLTDRVSQILFCPTETAVKNLHDEGYPIKGTDARIIQCGDVMQDSALLFSGQERQPQNFTLPDGYILATIHRAENTDDPARMSGIVSALNDLHATLRPVVLPLHPRTRKLAAEAGEEFKVHLLEPVGYLEMLWLLKRAGLVITDSGGLQKEAFFFSKPCVTMREQTEWTELIDSGANMLAGADSASIRKAASFMLDKNISDPRQLYGGGVASKNIAVYIKEYLGQLS